MFSLFGKNRLARRARSAATARTTAAQSRRRLCGWERLEDRSMLAISVVSSGTVGLGNQGSFEPAVSADGRYIAFQSDATNLVAGDTNGVLDVFLKDTQTNIITRISTDSSGIQGNVDSLGAAISADGRFVTFYSYATNLVAGDTNGGVDIFLKNTQTNLTTRVSTNGQGNQALGGDSVRPSISGDGRLVVFESYATNLVSNDTNAASDIFLKDTQTGGLFRVSTASNGSQSNNFSSDASISFDGRYVVFQSDASNLVAGDTNNSADIFVKDGLTNATIRVSTASNGTQGGSISYAPAISANGRYVTFYSNATNLVAGDTNNVADVFVKDGLTNMTTRVSTTSNGNQSNNPSYNPSISGDGRYVVYHSQASNLVNGDTGSFGDIFFKDTQTNVTTRLTIASDGTEANGSSQLAFISADGRHVVFESPANNMVSGDTNSRSDVFLVNTPASVAAPSITLPTATSVTSNSATLGGNVTSGGGAAITQRGILVAKTSVNNNPQLNGNGVIRLNSTNAAGVFTVNATGLDVVTGYSYVAFATNSAGTTYTTVDTFTTQAAAPTIFLNSKSNLTSNSVTLSAHVKFDNGATITERGILIAKTSVNANPQLNGTGVTKITAPGTTGTFSVTATGLEPATGFSYVAFATNSEGTSYTTIDTFTTFAAAPTVTSPTNTNITSNSATLGGDVKRSNGSTIVERGILVAKTSVNANPQRNGTGVIKFNASGTTGVFTVSATGLVPATGYSYVAFATYTFGTSYTTVDTFTTLAAAPAVTSPTATSVTSNSATLGGNVTTDNGAAITERGVLLSKTSENNNPQLMGNGVTKIVATGTTGVFTVDAAGLDPVTSYSYVAFATNDGGTTYTPVNTLTTLGLPEITVSPELDIFDRFANAKGTVISEGSSPITELGFVFSVTSYDTTPTREENSPWAIASRDGDTFFGFLTALYPTTSFTFAAYATNQYGTTYSDYITFTTLLSPGQFPGITVWNVNGSFYIYGTLQDDTIHVSSTAANSITVSSDQQINGMSSPQTFTFAREQAYITVDAYAGNDDITIAAPLNIEGLNVYLGTGNNRLVLGADPINPINNNVADPQFGTLGYLTVSGGLFVTGEEGDDRVIERSTSFTDEKRLQLGEGNNEYNVYWGFSNETIYISGAGQDNIYIGYLSSYAATQFNTGAGNDLVSSYGSRFYGNLNLASGAGFDTVALDVNIYDDAVAVDTGSEADYLLFSRSVAYKSVALTTGGGADTVLIGKYISGLDNFGRAIYSNGGSNIDQLTLYTNEEADFVQITANVMRSFYADLGDAKDAVEIEHNIFSDGLLDGGVLGTRIRNKGNTNLRTRNFSG